MDHYVNPYTKFSIFISRRVKRTKKQALSFQTCLQFSIKLVRTYLPLRMKMPMRHLCTTDAPLMSSFAFSVWLILREKRSLRREFIITSCHWQGIVTPWLFLGKRNVPLMRTSIWGICTLHAVQSAFAILVIWPSLDLLVPHWYACFENTSEDNLRSAWGHFSSLRNSFLVFDLLFWIMWCLY